MTQRLAVLTATYEPLSHAQQITGRFLIGYPRDGRWHKPETQVVATYVGQPKPGDQSRQRAEEFGFRLCPTIAEALQGVDAVLMFGDFFEACVGVFEKSGRAVPVYKGKHLADTFESAKQMVESASRLRFPLLAGSALPQTWRLPDLQLPLGCEIEEALIAGAGPDVRDALEAMLAMVERRKGGETGIRAVRTVEGPAVWQSAQDGLWSKQLLSAALSRSDSPQGLTLQDGRTQDLVASGEVTRLATHPVAYLAEHRDGLRTALLMLDGAIKDFTFAARVRGLGIQSTQFLLTPAPQMTYNDHLAARIEEMFTTGQTPWPVERNLLVCGLYESCQTSRTRGSQRIETPNLGLNYTPKS